MMIFFAASKIKLTFMARLAKVRRVAAAL